MVLSSNMPTWSLVPINVDTIYTDTSSSNSTSSPDCVAPELGAHPIILSSAVPNPAPLPSTSNPLTTSSAPMLDPFPASLPVFESFPINGDDQQNPAYFDNYCLPTWSKALKIMDFLDSEPDSEFTGISESSSQETGATTWPVNFSDTLDHPFGALSFTE